MKSKLFILLLLGVVYLGFYCTSPETKKSLLSQQNLPVTIININIDRDTLVQTPKGALLKIPAGSIKSNSGKNVKLELKEAYMITDIIRAGLFTQSNGNALSSGGMLYINAVSGQEVTITKKIQIAIPTDYANGKMQLYKGQEQANGNINWINPATLPENKQAESFDRGKILFEGKCATCHGIGKSLTAPDLAHFSKRFPAENEESRDYYYHYMPYTTVDTSETVYEHQADQRMDHAYEIYKCNLRRMYNNSFGTQFPDLDHDFSYLDIFRYIQNESDNKNLALPSQTPLKAGADSCEAYKAKAAELVRLRSQTAAERKKYISENGQMTEEINFSRGRAKVGNLSVTDFEDKVSPQNLSATYYQFSIESFGWYNIDILLKDINGVKESNLFVNIRGEWRQRVDLYLIIPEVKVFVKGGNTDSSPDQYAFLYKDGRINLPQNAKAYVLAVSEQNQKIAFALHEFNTTTQQQFDISLTETTKESFEAALNIFANTDMNISAAKTKNYSDIKADDEKIESIDKKLKALEAERPVTCDCDCGRLRKQL